MGVVYYYRQARELAMIAAKSQRTQLNMDDLDESEYDELYAAVENEITQLRVVLQAAEAKEYDAPRALSLIETRPHTLRVHFLK